jgi:hypothetical protein
VGPDGKNVVTEKQNGDPQAEMVEGDGDGGNLWVSVTNDGAGKSWVFRWTVPGARRERMMGLGPVHTVDLDEAREKARE